MKDILTWRFMAVLAGPAVAVLMATSQAPQGLSESAWLVACCMAWMAIWWIFEAVPVAVTALLPLILFPLLGISDFKGTSQSYAHPIIYLFLGGFILALGIERWNLHKRLALFVLLNTGGSARQMVGGFMIAAAMLSMWISNTATTMILLPMGLAIVTVIAGTVRDVSDAERRNFERALLLSIAYAATIGGVATLIGTPPNAFMAAFLEESYGISIGFAQWMGVGLPLTFVMLPLAWFFLCSVVYPFSFQLSKETQQVLAKSRAELGPFSREEFLMVLVFALTALGWMFRPLLTKLDLLSGLTDSGIAIIAGVTVFLLPSNKTESGRFLDWSDTRKLPWGVLLLFGGGLALAKAVEMTGLASVLATTLVASTTVELYVLVLLFVGVVIFFTELTSNLATTATFLPVIGALSIQMGVDPILLVVPVALAASCAFMMPVGTPPNAIVYSSGKLTIGDMARVGLILNIIAILAVSAVSLWLVPLLLQPAG